MITARCVKMAKKTQQPSLERCTTKVKFPFSGHKNADEHTVFVTPHYLRLTLKAVRVKDLARARCETKRSRATIGTEWSKDSDCMVSKSSCMYEWKRSLECLENNTTFQSQVSQQLCVNLLHIQAAHSIRTACSCPPHWRTTRQASETPQTKKRRRREFGICRANREVSKAVSLAVASEIGQVSD